MADGTIGSAAVYGDNYYGGTYTRMTVAAGTGATISGRLYKFDVYLMADSTFKVKVFRDDGTNYLYIGGEEFTLTSGLKTNITFTNPISVKAGDFLAVYNASIRLVNLTGGMKNKSGDVTSNTLKTDWTTAGYKASILGYIQPVAKGIKAIGNPMIF